MLAKRIIPCLDIRDGRVVKGVQFRNLKDAGDAVDLARFYVSEGADELVFLDISASQEKRALVYDMVEKVAQEVFIPFTIGGGLRSLADIREVLKRGADKVSLNTSAVMNPGLISAAAERFGSQCVVVAIDVKQMQPGKWEVFTHGGCKATGLEAPLWALQVEALGAGEILLTSMDRDGGRGGFDLAITKEIATALHIPVVASGGGGELHHFSEILGPGQADAALAASVFHYGTFRIRDVKLELAQNKIAVRL